MENRRRVTEEDLLITEALIAQSYGKLKQSVVQIPSRAYNSVSQTLRDHPYATAGTAVVGGVAMYGIIKMLTSHDCAPKESNRSSRQEGTSHMDILQHMLPIIIPLVTPYLAGYIQKYLGTIQSTERR